MDLMLFSEDGSHTFEAYSTTYVSDERLVTMLMATGHLLILRCRKAVVLLAFFVTLLMWSFQGTVLSVATPRCLASLTSLN